MISNFRRAPKAIARFTTILLLATGASAAEPSPSPVPRGASPDAEPAAFGAAATISATKAVIGATTFEPGDSVFYNIVLTNSGNGTQLDNPGDEFTDVLPVGLTLVGATATAGTIATAGNTVTWNGSIASTGGFFSISVEALIDAGTAGQTLSNQGSFNYDGDGNGTNESAGVTDDPSVPGAADPTDIAVGQPPSIVEIPVLSGGGFAALVVLLGGFALATLRRKRTA